MRDVVIPGALQDAMSREAQAAREKQARIILGQAEMEIAHSFEEAAKSYQHNPTALHLRAMNMLYEGLKEKGALMLIPSSAVESMGMGGLMGAAALRQSSLTGGGDAVIYLSVNYVKLAFALTQGIQQVGGSGGDSFGCCAGGFLCPCDRDLGAEFA